MKTQIAHWHGKKDAHIHSKHHLEILITHQWSAGEVVYVERIHFQLEVNTIGMLCAAGTTSNINGRSPCVNNSVPCLCVTHRQRMSV